MAKIIKFNTVRLSKDAESVDSDIKKINSEMEKLKGLSAQLDGMWDGPSSESFKRAFHSDMNELEKVINELKKIYDFETRARKEYEKCEKKVGQVIAGINI